MGFTDKIKAKVAELGLDEKARLAKEKAAAAAEGNRGKIADAVQKAGDTVNDKTGGKYADKVAKAQGAAISGVDKVAAQGSAAGTTTGSFGDQAVGTDSAIDRSIGQDGLRTADDQFRGESPVDRAIGADAPTSSLDSDTSFSNDQYGTDTSGVGTHDVRESGIDDADITAPKADSVTGEDRGATDSFGNKGFDAQGTSDSSFGGGFHEGRNTGTDRGFGEGHNTDSGLGSGFGESRSTSTGNGFPADEARGGDSGNDVPMRRVGDDLPEDRPHGDSQR